MQIHASHSGKEFVGGKPQEICVLNKVLEKSDLGKPM